MRLSIQHQTHYVYGKPVQYSIQQLRLSPRVDYGVRLSHWQIKVDGELQAFEDAFGNLTHTLVIDRPHQHILIQVLGEVETGLAQHNTVQHLPLPIYLRETPLTQADAALGQFARKFAGQSANHLMHGVQAQLQYIAGKTTVTTSAAQAFQLQQGVCQDFSHVFIACCRALGWPARYVSGYLFTGDGKGMRSHAWAEVWQDGVWRGLDIANGICVGEAYVTLAVGLDYHSASPMIGLRQGGGAEDMESMVEIHQLPPDTPTCTDSTSFNVSFIQQAHIAQQ